MEFSIMNFLVKNCDKEFSYHLQKAWYILFKVAQASLPVYLPNRQGCLFYHCATIRFEDDTKILYDKLAKLELDDASECYEFELTGLDSRFREE